MLVAVLASMMAWIHDVWKTDALIPILLLTCFVVTLPKAAVCRHACRMPSHVRLLWLMIGFFRIGEASNPGPVAHFEDCEFTLGIFNPSGLRQKANYFSSQLSAGDIWAVSETHFFGRDVATFRAGLRVAKSEHAYFVPDTNSLKPCLTTQESWRGVAVISKHPTRNLPSGLPDGVMLSGRAMLATTLLSDMWISGGVVYGEPDGHRYPHHLRNTEYLLHHIASHVCHLSSGCRYVAGDWNVDQDTLPAFDILFQAGFREVQDLALERWGQPIAPTCKQSTRKDFLYLSPELQELLIGVDILTDVWPDHAVVVARFQSPFVMPPVHTWPSPDPFPWPTQFDAVQWDSAEDPTVAYQHLWQQLETAASAACPFPVAQKCLGRAQRTQPKLSRVAQFAPVKTGRKGDVQPAFFGTSRRHAQWIKQVRRMQAYARLCQSDSEHAGIQRAESWGAIMRATGFHPDFPTWWEHAEFRVGVAPVVCPEGPPLGPVAWAMFDSLVMALRDLEKSLAKQSRQYARFRRAQNPNLIFSDIKPSSSPGVDVLLQPVQAIVEDVCSEEGKVVLTQECNFNPDRPIICDGQKLQVIHHEADAIWVENPEVASVGSCVSQTRMIGTHADIAQAFLNEWKGRWMKHADVPPERWTQIIAFAKTHLPANRFTWDSLHGAELADIIRRKKKNTSHGLDGVRLADLQRMPLHALEAFCEMYRGAETHGRWPSQVVSGKVVSLAKVPTPGSPSDFRPITVFSILYRCWSSYHAQKALASLESALPDTLYGSRQGRHATQIWSKLLWAIEWSYHNDLALTGMVLDLQKAFNLLPRLAVFEIAAHMGVPCNVLLGWAGALTTMQRYFLIRRSLSPGLLSVTGFPEGCGLSCVAMVLVDAAFHQWQSVFFPLCTAVSYVDDWQILCGHHDLLQGARAALDRFVHAMDLAIDARKTYAWSTTPDGRKCLRDQGIQVMLSAKNLGAHVQMSRKHTNATLMSRVQGMLPIWPKLRLSASGYGTKVRALKVAAWPRALHAVPATMLSDASFHSLRTGAMKGLDADGAGSNAWIHLNMVEHPMADPQFWAFVQTVRCIRECGDPAHVCSSLVELTHGDTKLPANGITATLMQRMQLLCWHVTPVGRILDGFGTFGLFDISIQELVLRAQWAWQNLVAQKVAHRPGFAQLHFADAQDTRAWVETLASDDRILFHKCLNGTHITQDSKSYCQENASDLCPFCECTDSRYHRFWECERFSHLRNQLSSADRDLIRDLPAFVSCYGWSLRPYTLQKWYEILASIPVPDAEPLARVDKELHFFTDGSCINQAFSKCRVASWAVVCVPGDGGLHSQVVGQGPLPGIVQSSYRAEIFAVWRALLLARNQQCKIYLWCDCQAVVNRVKKLLLGKPVRANSPHADLWQRVATALCEFHSDQVCITKVAAHRDVHLAVTPLEEWAFWHNHLADQAASGGHFCRPSWFWEFYSGHVSSITACHDISRKVQGVLLSISKAVVQADAEESGDLRDDLCVSPPVPGDAWKPLGPLTVPTLAVRWYGDRMVRTILSWFWAATFQSNHPVRWISQFQLYVDFLLCGGDGPVKLQRWEMSQRTPEQDLLSFTFQARSRWFSKVLKGCTKHAQQECTYKYCRPSSTAIMLHTSCLAVPWDEKRIEMVDAWFLLHCPGGVRRTSKAIQSCPVPDADARFPPIFVSLV